MPNWAWAGYMAAAGDRRRGTLANFLPGTKGKWHGQDLLGRPVGCRRVAMVDAQVRCSTSSACAYSDARTALDQGRGIHGCRPGQGSRRRASTTTRSISARTRSWRVVPLCLSRRSCRASAATSIDRTTYTTAEGVLNGEPAVAFGELVAEPVRRWLCPRSDLAGSGGSRNRLQRRQVCAARGTATGTPSRHPRSGVGDDVLFLPAPDFGNGPKDRRRLLAVRRLGHQSAHQGWGQSKFIEFATCRTSMWRPTPTVIGLIPATASAAEHDRELQARRSSWRCSMICRQAAGAPWSVR
jgi:multiple sugar transport system substrate-binding protein